MTERESCYLARGASSAILPGSRRNVVFWGASPLPFDQFVDGREDRLSLAARGLSHSIVWPSNIAANSALTTVHSLYRCSCVLAASAPDSALYGALEHQDR